MFVFLQHSANNINCYSLLSATIYWVWLLCRSVISYKGGIHIGSFLQIRKVKQRSKIICSRAQSQEAVESGFEPISLKAKSLVFSISLLIELKYMVLNKPHADNQELTKECMFVFLGMQVRLWGQKMVSELMGFHRVKLRFWLRSIGSQIVFSSLRNGSQAL